jgi:dynamin 1-like protein
VRERIVYAGMDSIKDGSSLNYFFGGPATLGAGASSGSRRAALPDVGPRSGIRADNPLSGRRGLEGSAAAFDMKSLEKHLDTVRRLTRHVQPALRFTRRPPRQL